MYISLYVVVNTFIGGRQPQNKLMRLRTFKKQGEHPKLPDPQCIKTHYQTTMMPKVPQSMGFYYGQMPK